MSSSISGSPGLHNFFLSICYSEGGFGESWVVATMAENKEEAKKVFENWLLSEKFNKDFIPSALRNNVFEKNELSLANVHFDPLGKRSDDPERTESSIENLKQKAIRLLEESPRGIAKQIFYANDHT